MCPSNADYNRFVAYSPIQSFSYTDFSVGFVKELPRGVYDSGKGLLFFITDLATHPFQTSKQVYEALVMLSSLAKSGQLGAIAETLSPEAHQLITQRGTLPDRKKGELAGYTFGKLGADILIPGATTKIAKSGASALRELGAICKNLQNAEKVFVLEAVVEGSAAGINVSDVVCFAEHSLEASEELGLTIEQVGALKQTGELKPTLGKGADYFAGRPDLQASYKLFKNAKERLKESSKIPMPELEARRLIHKESIPTFPRPEGIPENYLVQITDKGAGMEYVHPTRPATSVRVMPGAPHSSNLSQQRPYVIQLIENKALDKSGNLINPKSPEAHIPLEEYVYREKVVCGNK